MLDDRYEQWLADQRKARKGEALRRLNEGHGHSEKLFAQEVWWPAIGNFDFLHAEYEVANFRDGNYYLDHAYIRPPYIMDWEVDDFSSHGKNITRRGFDYDRDRQNHLMLQRDYALSSAAAAAFHPDGSMCSVGYRQSPRP